jgi:diguanylate cyclase (GGDEF)-like protein
MMDTMMDTMKTQRDPRFQMSKFQPGETLVDLVTQKSRLLWWLGIILTVGFLGSSLLGYMAARNTVRDNIVNQGLPLTSDTVYSEVQRELLRPISISAQMAENTFLRDWMLAGETDIGPVVRYLRNIKDRFGADTSFFISERTRKYYHPLGLRQVVRENDPKDAWYFRTRGLKTPYELNADPDEANRDKMTVFINYRLLNANGTFLGVTGVGITLNSLQKLLEGIEKRFERRVYFADTSGKIVLANNKDLKLGGSLQSIPKLKDITTRLLNKNAVTTSASYQNGNSMVQVHSKFVPELKWFLIIEQDEANAIAPFTRLLLINLAVGAIATVLVLALTVLAVNKYQARLEQLATMDSLTGAVNRSTGEVILEQVRKDAMRSKSAFCVVLFDIDDFKRVNDTHGHAIGDVVIRTVSGMAAAAVRGSDTLVRWGGEEFLMVFKDCSLEQAGRVAEEIRKRIAAHDFALRNPITISLGVAQHVHEEASTDLTIRADAALYAAKHRGKNRVEIAGAQATSPDMIGA